MIDPTPHAQIAAHGAVRLPSPRTLHSLVNDLGGHVDPNDHDRTVAHIAPGSIAIAGCLIPVLTAKACTSIPPEPTAVLVSPELADRVPREGRWVHPHARWALARLLAPTVAPPEPGISPHAIVETETRIGHRACIGPGAVILRGASIGDDCVIEPRAVIYGSSRIGHRVSIGAGAVIGRPGFGWVHGPDGRVERMPQPAGVVIEDDVEVGPLCTIDAGTLTPTRLRQGCKLDAQVHVAHNVDIGESTMIAAQSGFAGSVTIGRNVLVGGQVGVADHATIGDHARLAGRSGVIGPIPANATVAGYPAVDRLRWLRAVARMMRGRS